MIPILFDTGETEFTSNGLGRLADCISCTVTEERNGIYECEFQYPVTGEMYPEIQEGRILGVIHDDAHDIQPFDIYSRTAPLNGVVTFYAHHVSYRLGKIVLKPMTASSCAATLAAIPNNTYTECPFTFWTDKSVSATWTNEVPNPVKAILGGQAGSILDVYGKGEYEFDNFAVKLYVNRGNDNGVSIRYGVNLTEMQHEIDTSGEYTAVVPYWKSAEDDTVVTLDSGYVIVTIPDLVEWTDNHGNDITDDNGTVIEFNTQAEGVKIKSIVMDLSETFDEQPTQAQLRTEAVRRLNNSEAWLPSENITVSFIDLAHTEDYKDVAALQRVRLCDQVNVYCGPLGVSAVSMQVIKVVFNVLTERYDEIELGKAKTSFAQTVLSQVEEATKDLPTVSMMQHAIDNATDKITGAKGGHVRFVYDANGDPQEILIMDTEDIETAVNVWRWNSGGLGFSSNGYAGPYALAMTADGKIVANMITAGELDAGIIKTGMLDGELVKAKLFQVVDALGRTIATFDDTITLGLKTNGFAEVDYNSLTLYDRQRKAYLIAGDERDAEGIGHVIDTFVGDGSAVTFELTCNGIELPIVYVNGTATSAFTWESAYNPDRITFNAAPANDANIEVVYDTPDPLYRYDFGVRRNGTIGKCSVIFGTDCCAGGSFSIASGEHSIANGYCSHSEGDNTECAQRYGHAEGMNTKVLSWDSPHGIGSHAEGERTIAAGRASHAEGLGTIAKHNYQHCFGGYNIEDPWDYANAYGKYIEIVGNSINSNSRSNARTLDWHGNEWIAGTLTQASDARLKEESGQVPDLSSIRARRFRWNEKKANHDGKDHIGYFAQDVEKIAPYLVDEDASGYKSLDYIALLCAKVELLERRVAELEKGAK